jgi:HPt (histidine-containing phosphotransfer) domain-containing protein
MNVPARTEYLPVNMSILRDATNDDAEGMRYLADVYVKHARSSLDKIAAAIESQDATALELSAHGCAGSSASFGAEDLSELLRELEMMGRKKNLTGAAAKLDQVRVEYERVVSYLRKIHPPR